MMWEREGGMKGVYMLIWWIGAGFSRGEKRGDGGVQGRLR